MTRNPRLPAGAVFGFAGSNIRPVAPSHPSPAAIAAPEEPP